MNLVIVESPTKARTISKFLGKHYKVESSYGHIRDLPKSKLGIEIEKDFEPQYIIPIKSKKLVTALKKEASNAETVILATDLDREGEAIAWHLVQALGLRTDDKSQTTVGKQRKNPAVARSPSAVVQRIVFHEITKSAIEEALKNPRELNLHLVDAQQARRVLDRLVGYKLSPFLWKKVMSRLSAGRVQSVALRLIAEREEEIRKFKPEEYWSLDAILKKKKGDEKEFTASLSKISGKTVGKLDIKGKKEAQEIKEDLEKSLFSIVSIDKKVTRKNPNPPFTTSTMQQEASKRLRFSARETMRLAQGLYEAGLITYMRTDSVNLSAESVNSASSWIRKNLGNEYAKGGPRFFKTKSRLAQEAHEAIRPTDPGRKAENLKSHDERQKKLYDLIWRRFIASQLPPALFDSLRAEISASGSMNDYLLVANGIVLVFDGYLKVWPTKFEERELPFLEKNEDLDLVSINAGQHFTEPPPRYNEASLIKTLEAEGIGRPSTYAPIISVIQDRHYAEKNEAGRFVPTEIGELVNKVLVEHFPEIVDIKFTAKMEDELDEVANGGEKWQKVIRAFYEPFAKRLEEKYEEVQKQKPKEEATDEICPNCGKSMVIKFGRFGKFLACSGFPECKTTKPLISQFTIKDSSGNDMMCPECKEGKILRRRSKNRRFFFGCSRYPDCKYASWKNPAAEEKNGKKEKAGEAEKAEEVKEAEEREEAKEEA